MTHSEKRAEWWREGLIGLGVGVLYGTTSVLVGHPFDTVKTKMQAQVGFEKSNMFQSFTRTVREQGIRGLYRGCIPPIFGSGIYRSAQFAAFEGMYTFLGDNYSVMKYEIPYTGGMQVRVLLGGSFASTIRAFIETPIEVAKIKRQINQKWHFRELYNGFGVTWLRCQGLIITYFIIVDYMRRNHASLFATTFWGPFLISGGAATFCWWLVWPLEYMKSQVQGSYHGKQSVLSRMRLVIRERGGFFALYRGIGPGTIRSFLANGSSMVVMSYAQKKVSQWGLRKT
jgi:solute carrier family 25 carnitine/acylcarnitine transporter 20/29